MMNITIRPAVSADTQSILKIYSPFITDSTVSFETEVPTVDEFTARIKHIAGKYPYLVCDINNEIVGYAYASKYRERAAYKYSADVSIYVNPSYHRQGIGKALYTKLFELLKAHDIYTIFAGVTLPNDASIGIHKSLGFAEVGIYHNVGYKHGKWLDVMWLEKALRDYDHPQEI